MNNVPLYLLRGKAALSAIQLVIANALHVSNPFLAQVDSLTPVMTPTTDGSFTLVIRAIVRDGNGQPLVQPVKIITADDITAAAISGGGGVGTVEQKYGLSPLGAATAAGGVVSVIPDDTGRFDLTLTFAAGGVKHVGIEHPYLHLPVASPAALS